MLPRGFEWLNKHGQEYATFNAHLIFQFLKDFFSYIKFPNYVR